MKKKIVLIDYGVGNTLSVFNAIKFLGYDVILSRDSNAIAKADALVLPGVGAFEAAINNIKAYNLDNILNEEVLIKQKPIIGICLGMQLMATDSEENGLFQGLNWIPGHVKKIEVPVQFSVPHVGWNNIELSQKASIFDRLEGNPHFYFDHSYHYNCASEYIVASCDYGVKIISAIRKDNICGVQFHPEKSQNNGLKLFRGFLNAI